MSVASEEEVAKILQMETAPEGVVFEVVAGDESYLKTALDKFEIYQQQLKEKFPDIGLSIVSHGSEQFALTTANQEKHADAHSLVKRIIKTDVPVAVCGGHAKWRGLSDEDFPDYVEVPASGPAKIRDYQELGYLLVIL
ncbi:MAG: hypothetical protein ACPGSM_05890 [Thiolinea sp.]